MVYFAEAASKLKIDIGIAADIGNSALAIGRKADSTAVSAINKADDAIGKSVSALGKSDDAYRKGTEAIFKADDALIDAKLSNQVANDALDKGRAAINKADDALSKAGNALGTAFDAIDRIANIFNFIATLGTAARMEFIYNELKNYRISTDNYINEILGRLAKINEKDANQDASIKELYRLLKDLSALNNSQFDALIAAIGSLKQWIIPTYNNSFSILSDTATVIQSQSSIVSLLTQSYSTLIDLSSLVSALPSSLTPIIATETCNSVRNCSPAFPDFPEYPTTDLSSVLQGISEVNSRLGGFPNGCVDGLSFASVSDGLATLLCGSGDSGSSDIDLISNDVAQSLMDLSEIKALLNVPITVSALDYEIKQDTKTLDINMVEKPPALMSTGTGFSGVSTAFQLIADRLKNEQTILYESIKNKEAAVVIPEQWQVKLGAERPLLTVAYAESLGANKVGRSRYALSIPHWNGRKVWGELPRWRKGNYLGRCILKDNSKIILYAATEKEAERAIKSLLKFVNPAMILQDKIFIGKANTDFKTFLCEPCTAKFYPKGLKSELPLHYQIRIIPKT